MDTRSLKLHLYFDKQPPPEKHRPHHHDYPALLRFTGEASFDGASRAH